MAVFKHEQYNDLAELLKEAVEYDPVEGTFKWKQRPLEHFSSERMWKKHTTQYAGKKAGHVQNGRYAISFAMCGVTYKIGGSQIAWLVSGKTLQPGMVIDHIDGNPLNNRLVNLRQCSSAQNGWNAKVNNRNTSGCTGVKLNQGKWVASIMVNGKWRSLGRFEDKNNAIAARRKAEVEIKGEFLPVYLERELTEEEARWVNSIGSL